MRSYNIDLRAKVINFLKKGNTQKLATKIFELNAATVSRWWLRYKSEGHFKTRQIGGSKGKVNADDLKNMINKNGNITLKKIAEVFKVSIAAISKKLKQLGYSYKKKRIPTWKLVHKNVQSSGKL